MGLDELIEILVTKEADGYEWTQLGGFGLNKAKALVELLKAGTQMHLDIEGCDWLSPGLQEWDAALKQLEGE